MDQPLPTYTLQVQLLGTGYNKMIIGPGTTIGPGVTVTQQFSYVTTSAVLVYNLDFSKFTSLPTNGVSKDATGNYTLSVGNTGTNAMIWNSANGGVLRFTTATQIALAANMPYIYGGPNYTTAAQSYTVFMVYKPNTTGAIGRLLNTQSEAINDWLMGTYASGSNYQNVYFPNGTVNLTSDVADNNWHFIWGTWNATTGNLYLYIATNTAPAAVYKSSLGQATGQANNSSRGFNQLRLFSRAASTEQQGADVGLIQVYNGELSLTDIQTLWTQYKTRFGY
jgi:hypothetical protein